MRCVFKTSQNSQHKSNSYIMLLSHVIFTGRNCLCHTFLHKEHWLKATFQKPTKNLLLFLVYVYKDKSLGPFLKFTFKPCTASYTSFQMIRLILYGVCSIMTQKDVYLHASLKVTCVLFAFNCLLFVRP